MGARIIRSVVVLRHNHWISSLSRPSLPALFPNHAYRISPYIGSPQDVHFGSQVVIPACLPTPFAFIYIHRCSLLGDFDHVCVMEVIVLLPVFAKVRCLSGSGYYTGSVSSVAPLANLGTLTSTMMIPAFNGVLVFLQRRCRLSLCPLYSRSESCPGSASKAG